MNLKLEQNSILIIPNNIRKKVLKHLNNESKLFNIKIMTFNEVKKSLYFDYNEKTLYYLINNKNISYKNSKEYLDNLYYIDKINNNKINELKDIKEELDNNQLLIYDIFFKNTIKDKKIYIYGFTYINKYYQKIINDLKTYTKVEIINDNKNYKHKIYEFSNINDEIEFIINDIIEKKLDLNKVFISGINSEYKSTIKRIFSNYNIKINLNNNNNLYNIKYATEYLDSFDLDKVKDMEIKNKIINILNKYYFIKDKKEIKNILIEEFKQTKIKDKLYNNAVNEIELIDNVINDDEYIYLIGFNKEYIPKVFKDEDFINDLEKPYFLETTIEKNNNEYIKWGNIIKNIKNLTITYSKENLKGSLNPSSLIEENNYEVEKYNYKISRFSNKSNIFNLANLLDQNIKYDSYNDNIDKLLSTYKNINYLTYNNKYKQIDYKENFTLSYTKLNSYYECAFKYYCDYILKLQPYEQTFDAYAGSLCHHILQNMFNDNFDFNKEMNEYLNNNPFEFTKENKVFLDKMLEDLKYVIKFIKNHYSQTKYKEIECEKNINLEIDNIKFTGIIDKVMKYNDNIALIDYKTGETDIDLRLANYGLKLQLPVYIYLIKNIYPKSNITGIYLQHIITPIINKKANKDLTDQVNDQLKLTGYTINQPELISEFDPTYEKSYYIKCMNFTEKGFSKNSKVLSKEDFNNIYSFTENKIKEAIQNIKEGKFDINPKIKGIDNISCKYCPYKSICFMTDKDLVEIIPDDELSFLGGQND